MEENSEKNDEHIQTIVAILIAVVVVIAAFVAWRASIADDAAGDADFDGLNALVNAENTRSIHFVEAYEDYAMYTNYWRNARLAELIDADLEKEAEDQQAALQLQATTATDLADANTGFFETRYLNRNGTYNVQRQLGALWADAVREKDLEYETKFVEADRLRDKTHRLLVALMVLSIAPVFYSLVEAVNGRLRLVLIAAGSLFAVVGLVMTLLIEFAR